MISFPKKKYGIILADPPWSYTDKARAGNRGAESKYPCMKLEEIVALPVQNIAAKNCVLFLWVTPPMIREGLNVIKAWGFEYKTFGFSWAKRCKKSNGFFMGMGHWTRANAEPCLLAIKGKPKRVSGGVRSLVVSHLREHSHKPDEVRQRIVDLMGDIPRIELFARERVAGWDSWGTFD